MQTAHEMPIFSAYLRAGETVARAGDMNLRGGRDTTFSTVMKTTSSVLALTLLASTLTLSASLGACSATAGDGAEDTSIRRTFLAAEIASCVDRVPNGNETDTDCGGSCGKCDTGKGCKVGGDCATNVCRDGLCAGARSANGVRDDDESDVDCGGALAAACNVGQACGAGSDCVTNACDAGKCIASANDAEGIDDGAANAGGVHVQNAQIAKVVPAGGAEAIDRNKVGGVLATDILGSVPANAVSCGGAGAGRNTCGNGNNESCCTTIAVPGGSYHRYKNNALPATVSAFKLDKFEITQGRMRKFFEAKGGNLRGNAPAAGAGAHPLIASSGWRTEWNKRLPANWNEIEMRLVWGCAYGSDNSSYGSTTWTDPSNDNKPITCVDWYTLFAFCAWDGGRLPTDAEWGYAAMGGSEERTYTWGNEAPHANDQSYARLVTDLDGWLMSWPPPPPEANQYWNAPDGPLHISPPGHKPAGKSKWGHMDMNGNVLEWMLDNNDALAGNCVNCANVSWPHLSSSENNTNPLNDNGTIAWASDGGRVLRGGSFEMHPPQNTHRYNAYPVYRTYGRAGGRCAR